MSVFQSQVRLADAAVVDLMLTIIDTQLEMVTIDQEQSWTANSLPSAFRSLTPVVHNPCDARVNNYDWIQMYKQNTVEESIAPQSFCDNDCSLNAQLMMPSETLHYVTKCS